MEVQYLHTMHTLRNQLTMYHIHYKFLIAGPKQWWTRGAGKGHGPPKHLKKKKLKFFKFFYIFSVSFDYFAIGPFTTCPPKRFYRKVHWKCIICPTLNVIPASATGPKNAMPQNQQEHLPPIYYVYTILVPGIQTRPIHAHEYGEFHQ